MADSRSLASITSHLPEEDAAPDGHVRAAQEAAAPARAGDPLLTATPGGVEEHTSGDPPAHWLALVQPGSPPAHWVEKVRAAAPHLLAALLGESAPAYESRPAPHVHRPEQTTAFVQAAPLTPAYVQAQPVQHPPRAPSARVRPARLQIAPEPVSAAPVALRPPEPRSAGIFASQSNDSASAAETLAAQGSRSWAALPAALHAAQPAPPKLSSVPAGTPRSLPPNASVASDAEPAAELVAEPAAELATASTLSAVMTGLSVAPSMAPSVPENIPGFASPAAEGDRRSEGEFSTGATPAFHTAYRASDRRYSEPPAQESPKTVKSQIAFATTGDLPDAAATSASKPSANTQARAGLPAVSEAADWAGAQRWPALLTGQPPGQPSDAPSIDTILRAEARRLRLEREQRGETWNA
jgi:hypothetical protein